MDPAKLVIESAIRSWKSAARCARCSRTTGECRSLLCSAACVASSLAACAPAPAGIDQQNGKPHLVRRMDRPRVRVIPEWSGGGTWPGGELHEAAAQLAAGQAGLTAAGEPAIGQALDNALAGAARVVNRTVQATTDEITSELQEAPRN